MEGSRQNYSRVLQFENYLKAKIPQEGKDLQCPLQEDDATCKFYNIKNNIISAGFSKVIKKNALL